MRPARYFSIIQLSNSRRWQKYGNASLSLLTEPMKYGRINLKRVIPYKGEIGVEFLSSGDGIQLLILILLLLMSAFLFFCGDGADDGQQDPGADAGGEWR